MPVAGRNPIAERRPVEIGKVSGTAGVPEPRRSAIFAASSARTATKSAVRAVVLLRRASARACKTLWSVCPGARAVDRFVALGKLSLPSQQSPTMVGRRVGFPYVFGETTARCAIAQFC